MTEGTSSEQMIRDALNHLYDPIFLARSPLVPLMGLDRHPSPAIALRDCLEQAIKALNAAPQEPEIRSNRRYYQVLYYRYVQQFTQTDVATKLSISERHLRREQAVAIERLSQYLVERYRLGARDVDRAGQEDLAPAKDHNQVDREVSSLFETVSERWAELEPVMMWAVALAKPIADGHRVTIETARPEHAPLALVPPAVFKQCLLDLLISAIDAVPGGMVSVNVIQGEGQVRLAIRARPSAERAPGEWRSEALDIARRLLQRSGGVVELADETAERRAVLVLPAIEEAVVLAIEDNADTLQLWERYLRGSPCRLVGVTDSAEALAMAVKLRPQLVILDVMMPGTDGWEILGRIKQHPVTHHMPVIVCTVHPQSELALALGADGFLQKPVSRQAFRDAVLNRISDAVSVAPPR